MVAGSGELRKVNIFIEVIDNSCISSVLLMKVLSGHVPSKMYRFRESESTALFF